MKFARIVCFDQMQNRVILTRVVCSIDDYEWECISVLYRILTMRMMMFMLMDASDDDEIITRGIIKVPLIIRLIRTGKAVVRRSINVRLHLVDLLRRVHHGHPDGVPMISQSCEERRQLTLSMIKSMKHKMQTRKVQKKLTIWIISSFTNLT